MGRPGADEGGGDWAVGGGAAGAVRARSPVQRARFLDLLAALSGEKEALHPRHFGSTPGQVVGDQHSPWQPSRRRGRDFASP